MADLNPPGTYVPQLIDKDPAYAMREIQEAFQRLHMYIAGVLDDLASLGIVVGTGGSGTGSSPLQAFYQKVSENAAPAVAQRDTLDFEGAGVEVIDAGDRTRVKIPGSLPTVLEGGTENLDDYILFRATQDFATREMVYRSYR